jgi:hypothetical protein
LHPNVSKKAVHGKPWTSCNLDLKKVDPTNLYRSIL